MICDAQEMAANADEQPWPRIQPAMALRSSMSALRDDQVLMLERLEGRSSLRTPKTPARRVARRRPDCRWESAAAA